jgi:hypothetical protein
MNVAMLPCIKWQVTTAPSSCGIPCACITAKGSLVTGDAPNNPVALPVGTDGQALVACAACPTGLTWSTPAVTVGPATPTVAGTVLGCTTGTNAALGCNALSAVTTGFDNALVGYDAGCSITTGAANVFIGRSPGCSVTAGCFNILLGHFAGCSITTGGHNVAIGASAGSLTNGTCNVYIGNGAASLSTAGCFNIALGAGVQLPSLTGDCQLAIGFSPTDNWLTGDSSKNIQPGAGIKDCSGSVGSACQILTSTGTALKWVAQPGTNYRQCTAGSSTSVPGGATCTLLAFSITTSGNPVQLSAFGDANVTSATSSYGNVFFRRCGSPNSDFGRTWWEGCSNINESYALTFIDSPPAGTHCYALMACNGGGQTEQFGEALTPNFSGYELGTVAPGMTPTWTSAGTIQSVGWGATTTAPTIGTFSRNNVSYRQLGPKEWQVMLTFTATSSYANAGSGDYLFTLPNGLRFDLTAPGQAAHTTGIGQSLYTNSGAVIAGQWGTGQVWFTNNTNFSTFGAGPAIWDATRFRLISTDVNQFGGRAIGSGYWTSNNLAFNFCFQFTSL